MAALELNLQVARKAIDFIKRLGIRSTNVEDPGFWGERPLPDEVDNFILCAARAELKRCPGAVKERLRQVYAVLHNPKLSLAARRQELARLCLIWGEGYFYPYRALQLRTDYLDEQRIRRARRAVKARQGNCLEKSAIVATWLLENRPGSVPIHWVGGHDRSRLDHAFVVYGHTGLYWDGNIESIGPDAVIVDAWTEDYYQANSAVPVRERRPATTSHFQLDVRFRIQHSSGNIRQKEIVNTWPPAFAPNFRVGLAGASNSAYERRHVNTFAAVASRPDLVEEALEDEITLDEHTSFCRPE